ncbi:HCO3- transporter family protein [Trichomonas vaginalis G3]|uniref:HCO3-transporter family protein n=1 Tax=Trichomonas vaginalis (strain ATCC PRA-98 / G3) TaxID=412133 RepID=A2ETK2_TRIV3|nr:HCO3- transporter family protein [Trichomonas vaginalis G3]|eukprot:XP_001316271.1 HCO3- transporter family protein [Trichomonas vaginalis G3]
MDDNEDELLTTELEEITQEPSESDSSFSSFDALKDSLAYMSNIVSVPPQLELGLDAFALGNNATKTEDPLSFVTINIPRMTKPHLADLLISSFCNATYFLDKNPSNQFSIQNYEADMIEHFVNHPLVRKPHEVRNILTSANEEYGAHTHVLNYHEFLIITSSIDTHDYFEEGVDCIISVSRFKDITRIGSMSQHFTRFVIYTLITDEHPCDISNLIAVLLELPKVYSTIWNSHDEKEIKKSFEQSESDFLIELATAHQAMEKVNEHLTHDISIGRADWVHRQMLLNHEMMFHHKHEIEDEEFSCRSICQIGRGVINDFKRRIHYYWSDWRDGFSLKPIFVAVFLALGILPYVYIFGTSIEHYTGEFMNTWHVLVSCIGAGIFMSIFSPQPMIFLSPSAAFILFLKACKNMAKSLHLTLEQIYPMTAIFAAFFLLVFSLTNISTAIKYVTSFSDEVFVAFVAFLFLLDSIKEVLSPSDQYIQVCSAFTALCVFVVTFAINRIKFNSMTYSWLRSIASDGAPVISSIGVALFLSYVFPSVYKNLPHYSIYNLQGKLEFVTFSGFSTKIFFVSMLLGFCAAILILLEHNVTAKLVNGEEMKLRKPCAYHLDILVLAVVNLVLGLLNLPLVTASKIHTFHHIHAMSVHTFEYDEEGNPSSLCINVSETRLTGLLSHILLFIVLLFPKIMTLPRAVFAGVLAFMGAITLLNTTLLVHLISLFWKPENLPPNHWLRNVKRWKILAINILQIGCIVSIYFIEHSIIGFLYPVFIILIVALYRTIYYFFPEDMMMIENGFVEKKKKKKNNDLY